MTATDFDPAAEFDRQVDTLIRLGYPALAGRGDEEFSALLAPLRPVVLDRAGGAAPSPDRVPFVLVINHEWAPADQAITRTTLAGRTKPGFVDRNYRPGELHRFVPDAELDVPTGPAYVALDLDRGADLVNDPPDKALRTIAERGRSPLTIAEGIALITQFPEMLEKNKCFSLIGSRCGDRRVPALWISQGAPKLGWCFAGVPHTWLGSASCLGRVG